MCDTLIANSAAAGTKASLFAKNSDRSPNEAQLLNWIPENMSEVGHKIQCTYIDIPQSRQTNAVLLSRPFWIWGGEMGVNQHGLAIGNEAIFSKIPANKTPALIGMDLLRLGLERARTAPQAVDVITSLLEEFGQGGKHTLDGHSYYHNSYLIVDSRESWVLETVDRHWAARQVGPLYSISNSPSLETDWDRSSAGLEEYIIHRGLAKSEEKINLSANISDRVVTTFAAGRQRCARSRQLLEASQGEITVSTMASILRDHGSKSDPRPGLFGADICMHASLGPVRVSQTTGSLIALLEADNPLVFATGTAAPCTGIFKPFWVDAIPDLGKLPTDQYDPETLFWSHERLHREVLGNYPERLASFEEERDSLEEEFITGAISLQGGSQSERKAYSEICLTKAAEAEQRWLACVSKIPPKPIFFHDLAWKGFNRHAKWQMD